MGAAHQFLRNMLWRRGDMLDHPEPVVALLGPPGSGRTAALDALSLDCGGTVVHAKLDFGEPENLDPIAAVGFVAFELMRGWTNLPREPTFHRVGLTLLALNEKLDEGRGAAREQIAGLIKDYVRGTREGRTATRMGDAANASVDLAMTISGLDATPQGRVARAVSEQAKPAIAALLQGAARLRLRGALRWHSTVPEAEDAGTIDSLISLSRTRRREALDHLMRALLADIQDNVTRHAAAPASCRCALPRTSAGRHEHAWVLLVDNAGNARGRRFLTALIRARQERAAAAGDEAPERDPLLVVAATEEWSSAWGKWWCEPWRVGAEAAGRSRVPLFGDAGREQWLAHARAVRDAPPDAAHGWYPVWLDPLDAEGAAGLAPTPPVGVDDDAFGEFVRRLSGDWPAAVRAIGERLAAEPVTARRGDPLPRNLLGETGERARKPLWERAVRHCLPDELPVRRPWASVPVVVTLAAHLSDAERSSDELDGNGFPTAAGTLRMLRTRLWLSTFHARPSPLWSVAHGDAEHPAALHPWLARCLFAGLAADAESLWDDMFTRLAGQDRVHDERAALGRRLFASLARNEFDDVVKALAAQFAAIDHREWIRLLDRVTSAPCRWPAVESTEETVARFAPEDHENRTPVEAAVTNLVVLLWLYRDPLTVPEPRWDKRIHDSFDRLKGASRRSEVDALDEAAGRFAR